jgi:hypothetical protein
VEKVKNYYDKSSTLIPVVQDRQEEIKDKLKEMDEASKDIPTLL